MRQPTAGRERDRPGRIRQTAGTTADSFIWNADGALHDEAGNTVPVEGLGRDFVIVGDSIYFNQSNGANANLAALHYDAVNDHWSAPILLIGDEQYLENLNAAELNGKTYALGMHTTVTITADDVDDTKDLVWTQILARQRPEALRRQL